MPLLPVSKRAKGSISRIEQGRIVSTYTFQMNPSDLSRSRDTNWADLTAPGTTSNQAMFINVGNETIQLKLFLATLRSGVRQEQKGILSDIAEIESWGLPSLDVFAASQYEYIPPPTLIFSYGTRSWMCTARSIKVNETMHDNDLYPMVADVDITLKTHHDTFQQLSASLNDLWMNRQGI